jgi:hypothetical protein
MASAKGAKGESHQMSQLADGMPELANVLAARQGERERRDVYSHMQALEQQVHATQQALALALDSARLNP